MGMMFNWSPPAEPANHWYRRRVFGGLESVGWTEGKNLAVRRLFSDGKSSRLPGMVQQLVDEKADVIWVTTTSAAVSAVHATKKIPIVLAGASAYPVECGLIESFARPGGNITGVAFFQGIVVHAKLAQFVRELLPSAKRLAWVAILPDLVTVGGGHFRPETYYRRATHELGFELGYYECSKIEDFGSVFAAMQTWGAQAAIFEPAGLSSVDATARIAHLTTQSRIPTFFSTNSNVAAGGLLSYGPKWSDVLDRSVVCVDKILRGAWPGDLPVEMPNKLQLAVNLKTARALGIEIPKSILLQADRVIE